MNVSCQLKEPSAIRVQDWKLTPLSKVAPARTAFARRASSKADRSMHSPWPVDVKKKSAISGCSLDHSETLPAVLKRPGSCRFRPSASLRKCSTRPIEVGGKDSPSLKLADPRFSTNSTRWPYLANVMAVADPAGPEPTMTTSHVALTRSHNDIGDTNYHLPVGGRFSAGSRSRSANTISPLSFR